MPRASTTRRAGRRGPRRDGSRTHRTADSATWRPPPTTSSIRPASFMSTRSRRPPRRPPHLSGRPSRRPTARRIPLGHLVHQGHPGRGAGRGRGAPRRRQRGGCVPVLVAYNLPFRDCSQYSAGGAAEHRRRTPPGSTRSRPASARATRSSSSSPTGSGSSPGTRHQRQLEWCQPAEADPRDRGGRPLRAAEPRGRRLRRAARTSPSTSTGRTAAGSASATITRPPDQGRRRARRRVLPQRVELRADRPAREYSHWISDCIYLVAEQLVGARLVRQPVLPAPARDPTSQHLGADRRRLRPGVRRHRARAATRPTQAHFVIDTSRNGQGPWTPPAGVYTDARGPGATRPDRGLGLRADDRDRQCARRRATSGSRCRASPTASATAAPVVRSIPSAAWSTRRRGMVPGAGGRADRPGEAAGRAARMRGRLPSARQLARYLPRRGPAQEHGHGAAISGWSLSWTLPRGREPPQYLGRGRDDRGLDRDAPRT